MGKRRYSDQDKAVALAALDTFGGNVSKAAEFAGVPRTSLNDWRDGKLPDDVTEIRHEKTRSLADLMEEVIREALGILPDKLAACRGAELATVVGILTDKRQLLTGEATSITQTRDDPAKRERVRELSERHGLKVA